MTEVKLNGVGYRELESLWLMQFLPSAKPWPTVAMLEFMPSGIRWFEMLTDPGIKTMWNLTFKMLETNWIYFLGTLCRTNKTFYWPDQSAGCKSETFGLGKVKDLLCTHLFGSYPILDCCLRQLKINKYIYSGRGDLEVN